jgi:DASS family divalent anion:Na+ symporter
MRIAYLFMRCFGKNIFGLSYSIIMTEFLVAPAMPSSTARTASIGLPLIKSLTEYISTNSKVTEKSIGSYLCLLYSGSSAICSAAYATGMVSNILIIEAMNKVGIEITWLGWFKYAIIPCVLMLILLPVLLMTICNPGVRDIQALRSQAAQRYKEMGKLTTKERYIIAIFAGMLLMWVFSGVTKIPIIVTSLLGLIIFLSSGFLDIKTVLSNAGTTRAVLILGLLISYVNNLIEYKATEWCTNHIAASVCFLDKDASFLLLSTIYFLTHFFFSGEGARIVALYAPFLAIGISLGINPIHAAMTLAAFSSISNILTNYTSPVTIMIASTEYTPPIKWVTRGLITALFVMIVWHATTMFLR